MVDETVGRVYGVLRAGVRKVNYGVEDGYPQSMHEPLLSKHIHTLNRRITMPGITSHGRITSRSAAPNSNNSQNFH